MAPLGLIWSLNLLGLGCGGCLGGLGTKSLEPGQGLTINVERNAFLMYVEM